MESQVLSNDIIFKAAKVMVDEGRDVEFKPKGTSMLPFIKGEVDSVVLRKNGHMDPGDIVLANISGRYIMHRVIKREGENLTLMGDGNIKGTEECLTSDVIGTVVEIIKPSGRRLKPTKGKVWRFLRPCRRVLLAVYRRLPGIRNLPGVKDRRRTLWEILTGKKR